MFRWKSKGSKKNAKKVNKGFSLLEVLVSMLVLALIMGPILGNILRAGQASRTSRKIQDASTLGQSMMEGLKSQPSFEEVAKQMIYKSSPGFTFDLFTAENLDSISTKQVEYNAATGGYGAVAAPCITKTNDAEGHDVYTLTENTDRKYWFEVDNIEFNGRKYAAIVKYDASTYSKENPGDEDKYNDEDVPVLPFVSKKDNAVIVLNYQDNWAISTLQQMYNEYYSNNFSGENNKNNDDIAADMKRRLTIDISKNASDKYVVKAAFRYELQTLIPEGLSNYPRNYDGVFYQQEFDDIENVYLFYTPNITRDKMSDSTTENIIINNNLPAAEAKLKFYLVEQNQTLTSGTYDNLMKAYKVGIEINENPSIGSTCSTAIRTNLGTTLTGFDPKNLIMYTNVNRADLDEKVLIDKVEDKTRIYDISLDLYYADSDGSVSFDESHYFDTFTSSKGE